MAIKQQLCVGSLWHSH